MKIALSINSVVSIHLTTFYSFLLKNSIVYCLLKAVEPALKNIQVEIYQYLDYLKYILLAIM